MNNPRTVLLLRAFGDFLIAVHLASKSRTRSPITLIASKHLEPLYEAIAPELPGNIHISFHDFKIRGQMMGCFTNKFLFHPRTCIELLTLRNFVHKQVPEATVYLEQKKRAFLPRLFCVYPFHFIVERGSVYKAYADFFSVPLQQMEDVAFKTAKKILVIPDARQTKRVISERVIQIIRDSYGTGGTEIIVARFKKEETPDSGDAVMYHSFGELVSLIRNADLFIGSDSMPVHLAQFLGKPHYILYPRSVPPSFFTPFALRHKTYFTFEDLISGKSFFRDE